MASAGIHKEEGMEDLSKIGFYTLSNHRAINSSYKSDLYRCEMIVTDRCNFNCPYCRGVDDYLKGDIDYEKANDILDIWISNGLKNIRFSGGEPTLYPYLDQFVKKCKKANIKNIALSTNGSADIGYYKYLNSVGVNDFSISLDSCCSSTGRAMCGNIDNQWEIVTNNIREISKWSYVTVGVVLTEKNSLEVNEIVKLADRLGVSDIRIIPAAQDGNNLSNIKINDSILKKYPILDYRMRNIKAKKSVRGISKSDSNKCYLMLDDMAVCSGYHFPCIIYLREKGYPIGKVNKEVRHERFSWFLEHNSHYDIICQNNCLDVCVDYNNFASKNNEKN
jgi:molybdenum cofactor biosynthesis enzyme MoaA